MHDRSYWWRPEDHAGRSDWRDRAGGDRPYWWRDDNLPFDHDEERAARAYREGYRDRDDDARLRESRHRDHHEYDDRNGARRDRRDFRGVGPRLRADEDDDLREELIERLRDDPDLDASDILVRVIDNEAILDGTVRSKRDAGRAQDLADDIRGIVYVRNRLSVGRSDDRVRRATIGMGYDDRPARTRHRERRRWS